MKKHRNLIFYILTISIFSIIIYCILRFGTQYLEGAKAVKSIEVQSSPWQDFLKGLMDGIGHPLSILLLQIVVILLAVRIFGWLCKKIGQPTVVGEIIAGVVLGPSLLGLYFPHISGFIFPVESLGNIQFLSQVGLVLFMFIIGMELDLKTIKTKANDAVLISHASIIFPFALGLLLAYFIYEEFTHHHTHFASFALFMGIAMSITAFPVLARIVHEKGINKTPLGGIIITCAAIDDITAWCILAGVIAIVKAGSFTSAIFIILSALLYVLIMFKVVKPFLQRIADSQVSKRIVSQSSMAIFFIVLFLSAYTSEIIGIHALFGAFLAGVVMPPKMNFRNLVTQRIEDVALTLLLPLFFVYTGLRTEIGLLNSWHLWGICFLITLVAITGKFWGSALAARFVGSSWKDSLTIGTLMNTRGLMELVVLNIGLDLGILTSEVFAMMVVMALVTTFMTSPILSLIDRIFKKKPSINEESEQKKSRILVSFKEPVLGQKLLYLANCFIRRRQMQSELVMLHLSEGNAFYQHGMEEEEEDIFISIDKEAHSLNQPIEKMFKVTNNIYSDIAKTANNGEFNFLFIGHNGAIHANNMVGRMIGFSNKVINIPDHIFSFLLGGHKRWPRIFNADMDEGTRTIISKSNIPVGIFIDKGLLGVRTVFVPILDEEDVFIGPFMERLAENSYVRIMVWDPTGLADRSIEFVNSVKAIKAVNPYLFQLWNNNIVLDSDIISKYDLAMVSIKGWKKLENKGSKWIKDLPSTLVLIDG